MNGQGVLVLGGLDATRQHEMVVRWRMMLHLGGSIVLVAFGRVTSYLLGCAMCCQVDTEATKAKQT